MICARCRGATHEVPVRDQRGLLLVRHICRRCNLIADFTVQLEETA